MSDSKLTKEYLESKRNQLLSQVSNLERKIDMQRGVVESHKEQLQELRDHWRSIRGALVQIEELIEEID